jgi:ABC-type phosphonate transport system ATPase subunit
MILVRTDHPCVKGGMSHTRCVCAGCCAEEATTRCGARQPVTNRGSAQQRLEEDEVRPTRMRCGAPRSVAGQIQQRRGGGVECRGSTVGTGEWSADASEW